MNWNAIGDERQELKLNLETPYIFNSRITPNLSFNIYRQDSTFINTKFSGLFNYSLNQKTNLGLSVSRESSENTSQLNDNNESFNNLFGGINFEYRILSDNSFQDD